VLSLGGEGPSQNWWSVLSAVEPSQGITRVGIFRITLATKWKEGTFNSSCEKYLKEITFVIVEQRGFLAFSQTD
jgi:hypothetical protein